MCYEFYPFILLTIGNPLLIWWHISYIFRTVHPLSHPSWAINTTGMQGNFAGICVIGALLIGINGLVGSIFLGIIHALRPGANRHSGDPKPSVTTKTLYSIFYVLSLAGVIFVTFVQFLSPFVTPTEVWKSTYKNACAGMDTRVYLDAAKGRPAGDIGFVDLPSGERYGMRMYPDPNVGGFDEQGVYNFTLLPSSSPVFRPDWERVSYDLAANTFVVFAANGTVVLNGGFGTGRNWSVPALGLRGDLEPFATRCVFDPTVEIYGGVERRVVVKTVQFEICGRLQVCAEREVGDLLPVPVGLLVLQRAKRGGNCCKGRYLPGVEGRGD